MIPYPYDLFLFMIPYLCTTYVRESCHILHNTLPSYRFSMQVIENRFGNVENKTIRKHRAELSIFYNRATYFRFVLFSMHGERRLCIEGFKGPSI